MTDSTDRRRSMSPIRFKKTLIKEEKKRATSSAEDEPPAAMFLLSTLRIGGSERKVVRIANFLCSRGHGVHIGYLNGPHTLLQELHPSISVVCLDRVGKFSLPAVFRLKKYVRGARISRIICVNLYPLLYAMALKYFVSTRGISCVLLINTTVFLTTKQLWQMFLYSRLMKRADRIVFGCRFQLEQWIRQYGLIRARCEYIYNGVDHDWYSPPMVKEEGIDSRRSYGLDPGQFVVGSVGGLRPEKQHKDLIAVADRLVKENDSFRVLLVGDGPERAQLENLVKEKRLGEKVLFLGEVRDVRPALAIMDVFVLTSVAVETFSNAALEAMSMGKPVILSDVGGACEMVSHGLNGFVYQKGKVEELVLLLRKIMESPQTRLQLGENARRIVVQKFTFSQMVHQYEKLVSETY